MSLFQIKSKYFFGILNAINDDIYISDKNGRALWANYSAIKNCGIPLEQMIGKNASELEKQGIFKPSIVKKAYETMKTTTTVQKLPNGQKYLATGYVVFNDNDELKYIIAHRRDITQVIQDTSNMELKDVEILLQQYIDEIQKINIQQQIADFQETSFVGQSQNYIEVLDTVRKIASVDTTVLITGETGVGKNVVAKQIHNYGERREKPFIHINCASIPESLIESELFGYEKGAFTGASSTGKLGLIKLAEHGTLFLDEISELPLQMQSKLLQVLQDKTYMPIGGNKTYKSDVRIIAATNTNLEELTKKKEFRSDLFYRLNVLPIALPPLRERKKDILPLLNFYLKKLNAQHRKQKALSKKTITILKNYNWPGNIRELENLIERLVILTNHSEISLSDLPKFVLNENNENEDLQFVPQGESLSRTLQIIEKNMIEQAYKKHSSIRKTASSLGVTSSLLMRRLQKYNIEKKETLT